MVRAVFAVSILLFGCGKVSESTSDAAGGRDGNTDGATCPGDEVVCDSDGCVDVLTDERHCGDCTTSCTNQQGCLAGDCVDSTESCARIKALDPNAIDGPYTHVATGKQFFCDMTRGVQYDQLAMGQYNASYPGYQLAGTTELSDPVVQRAFIFLFNHQGGGMITLTPAWTLSNCCFSGNVAGTEWIQFGGTYIFVAKFGAPTLACGESFADPKYSFQHAGADYAPVPLPADYFQIRPVGKDTTCGPGNNPAFFFKRIP
jgi:hypothetical protein